MANNTYTFVGSEIRPITGIEDTKILSAKYVYDDKYIQYNNNSSINNLHDIILDLQYIINNLINRLNNLEGAVKYNIYLKDESGNINNNVNCTQQVIPFNYNGSIEIKALNNYYIIENGISSEDVTISTNENACLLASVTISNAIENESKSVNITVQTEKVYASAIQLNLDGSPYTVGDTFNYSINYTPNVTDDSVSVHNDHKGVSFSFEPEGYIEFKNNKFNIIKGDKTEDNKTIKITAKTTKNKEKKSDYKEITFVKKTNTITASDITLTYNNSSNIGATVNAGNLTYEISSGNDGNYISLSNNTIKALSVTPSNEPVEITIKGEPTEKYKEPSDKKINVTVNKANNPASISKTGLNGNSIASGGEFTITVKDAIGDITVTCENDGVNISQTDNTFKITCPNVTTNTNISINVSIGGDNNHNGKYETIDVTILKPSIKYYWYVGQENPASMTSISPIVDDNTSPGWRLIGDKIPTYSSSNKLWIGTNVIQTGSSLQKQYVVIPANSSAAPRDGAGNDASTVAMYNKLDNIVINNVTYKVYESSGKGFKFNLDIF